jgi:hypothetical protein
MLKLIKENADWKSEQFENRVKNEFEKWRTSGDRVGIDMNEISQRNLKIFTSKKEVLEAEFKIAMWSSFTEIKFT